MLALWNLIGGGFVVMNYEKIRGAWVADLPKVAWIAYGGLQVLFALGLLWPKLTPLAAIALALLALLGCGLFTQYAGFPGLLWGVIPAALAAFVAYGRFVLKPF